MKYRLFLVLIFSFIIPVGILFLKNFDAIHGKFTYGLSFEEVGNLVSPEEAKYFKDFKYIFNGYNLILTDRSLLRGTTTYYFVEKAENNKYDREIVKKRLIEKGWTLVEQKAYGEFYCDKTNNDIGITFPKYIDKKEKVKKGYYLYQTYKKVSVGFGYTLNGEGLKCKRKAFET